MLNTALGDTWSFFKNHFISLSLIILPLVIPLEIFSYLYLYSLESGEANPGVGMVLNSVYILVYPIYSIAVVFYISSVISDRRYTLNELYSFGLRYWLPYLFLTIVTGIIVLAGIMLFIIPGIIFLIKFSFAQFELLFKQQKVVDAMRSSWGMTGKYFFVLVGGYLIITVLIYAPVFLYASTLEEPIDIPHHFKIAANIIYSVFNVVYTIFAFRVYEFSKEDGV